MHRPVPQEFYRHFKGGKYQVITIAKEADTGEEKVVYQALYGDYTVYCRPLSEFVSEVDRQKYPNADQNMRFELFSPYEDQKEEYSDKPLLRQANALDKEEEKVVKPQPVKEEPVRVEEKKPEQSEGEDDNRVNDNYMNRTIEEEAEDFGMNPLVVRFLDAGSSAERIEVLNLIRPVVTNEMIDVMAMSIDTEIPGDDPDVRCAELRECLLTKQRFEVTRLR